MADSDDFRLEFRSGCGAGGIMFEKVLKRLCPCYFKRKNGSDSSACQTVPVKTSFSKQILRGLQNGNTESGRSAASTTVTAISNNQDSWKGTLNLVQPQPIYAFPLDLKKSRKRNQKNLLKPPLYWKKAPKLLPSEGPLVFQESKSENILTPSKMTKKKKISKAKHLKYSETIADISSVSSPSTVEVQWLKSQSLDNLFESRTKKTTTHHKKDKNNRREEWNNETYRVIIPDISHGVILFTAAYFNKKKTCIINIDRLENLSKKGREGNTYYTVIKISILPSEKYIKSTKVLVSCSNPEVKQDFSFSVKELNGKVLRFSVFDASLPRQHEAIGHALLTLEDIVCNQPKKYRVKLYRTSQPHVSPGNLRVSLKYSEDEDKFTIAVDRGKNLSLQKEKNVKLNTYVKVTLYSYGEKIKTKKSLVVCDSRDPNYNSTFTFQVRKDQIDNISITIAVRLRNFVNDSTIGRLIFGPFFFIDNKNLTPWGRVFLKKEFVCHWFRMYL